MTNRDTLDSVEEVGFMKNNPWEFPLAIGFLILCLVAGLMIDAANPPKPVIGVVRFADIIYPESADRLLQVVNAARNDDSIVGVVLEIDSPGGYATSSESIFYSLLQLRKAKPLIVNIDGMAASGGYYMAVAANRIYAAPSSYIGNVGVRGPRPFDPYIDPMELSTGPYKLAGASRFDQIQQLELLKTAFVGNVVHQRSHAVVNPLKIDAAAVAEAKLYPGSQALGIGYIDAEGSRSDAINAAAELAGMTDYEVVDLIDYYGFDFRIEYQEPTVSFADVSAQVFAGAPENAIYFLDSRIPLPSITPRSAIEQHLLQLRAASPMLRAPTSQLHAGAANQSPASLQAAPAQQAAEGSGK
ncbi:MAG: S49 family peptidase [Caldilinea sp. CFX5]|nr:S49 family peptidase [Caldilinea sp. CFX5]